MTLYAIYRANDRKLLSYVEALSSFEARQCVAQSNGLKVLDVYAKLAADAKER